jgi:hypothetical protein
VCINSVSYQRSILPVYVGAGQPESYEGTAFLLRAGSSLFLVSACHVLERFDSEGTWIPVHGFPERLSGDICRVQSSGEDRYDVAVVLLNRPLTTALFSEAVFCPSLLRLNAANGSRVRIHLLRLPRRDSEHGLLLTEREASPADLYRDRGGSV